MLNKNCNNYLTSIAISIIISLILTLLFFNNVFTNITYASIFALILSLITFFILTIFGASDNGLTRSILCHNSLFVIISILGNIFFNLFIILIPISPGSIFSAILVGFAFFFTILNIFNLSILLISILRFSQNFN